PGAPPGPRLGVPEVSETTVGVSGRLRFESPASQPSLPLPGREEQPAFSEAKTAASSMPVSDFAASPVEGPPASSDVPAFSPPPAPPIFTSPSKASKSAQSVASIPGSETEQRAHNDARRFARL